MATTNFPVQITTSCTLNPQQVPPAGPTKCQKGSTITFTNDNVSDVNLIFAGLAGNPFGATPPLTVSNGSPKTWSITVSPAAQTSYPYSLSCNSAAAGIIIVDGGGGPHRHKASKTAKKKTGKATRGKSKAKAGSKRPSGGTGKKSKGKTKKAARRKKK